MILLTVLKKPQWTVLAGNKTYSPTLLRETCLSVSQHFLLCMDNEETHLSLHWLQKEMPFSLDGGPVSLPLGRLTMTKFFSFPFDQRVATFCFCLSTCNNSSGGHFLAPYSGLGGDATGLLFLVSSGLVGAAVELLFLFLQHYMSMLPSLDSSFG